MNIYGHIIDEKLQGFLMTAPRYKLAVAPYDHGKKEEKSVDVGKELARAVSSMDRKQTVKFQFGVEDAVSRIVKDGTFQDKDFGSCIVLENVGILFEKELRFDVMSFLKRVSKNTFVILLWPGEITQDKLFFLSEDSGIYISQTDINYTTI